MGEPYIYYCPVGLIHIAVPVMENGKLLSCAVAGPLVMGETDERYPGYIPDQAYDEILQGLDSLSPDGLRKAAEYIKFLKSLETE